tara:strand:- start:2736 stop:3575 length:840 start_codon:yes stop_codon:yes gene_type:complete
MPSFENTALGSIWKRMLQVNQSSNTGIDATTRNIQDGEGNNTSLSLSDDNVLIKPVNDNTNGTLSVQNAAGTAVMIADTTNMKVMMGASGVAANTFYVNFGIMGGDAYWSSALADTHYAIPFSSAFAYLDNTAGTVANYALGSSTSSSFNDTEPASSLTISTTAMSIINSYWYVMDNITIDDVIFWQGADAATGDSTAAYLMGYSVDRTTDATAGDLSSGVKLASSATVTNAGYEQAYYKQLTIHSADVDAGSVILFTFCSDTVNSDYTINATIKAHIR